MKKQDRSSERGGAGVRLLLTIAVLTAIAHAGYHYIPVAYQAESFRQEMQTAVIQGVAIPAVGKTPADAVKDRVIKAARGNDLPGNALIEVMQANNIVQAHVRYSKLVPILPFGLYNRKYDFDYVATPTGFLTKD